MNWLKDFVRPKIRALVAPREVPENLWVKCPSCDAMVFHRDLEANLHVCPHCGHHMRIGVEGRLKLLFDQGAWTGIELPQVIVDPLKFRDTKRYTDRLKEAQARTGRQEAIVVAHGTMGGAPVVVAAFDFSFMGGSMGMAVGEALLAAARLAVMQRATLIAIPASGGARMQEGILSLMQMPRSVIAIEQVKEAGLPYLVVLTDPTTGGVSASFAMLGDIHIAEPGAQIGFAGKRVIQETIRQTLPEGFQTAEYLMDHGMVDMVVPRGELRAALIRVITLLTDTLPSAEVVPLKPEAPAALPQPEPAPEEPVIEAVEAAQQPAEEETAPDSAAQPASEAEEPGMAEPAAAEPEADDPPAARREAAD